MLKNLGRWLPSVADRLLPIWFLAWTAVRLEQLGWTGSSWDFSFVGRDFWIYRNAAMSLISGGDPWSASALWNGTAWHFAAPPTAAQLFVPFAELDASVGLVVFVGLSIGVVLVGLSRVGLAAWWLLFPPMTEGLFAANPQILLIGLLLVGSGPLANRNRFVAPARAIAVGLKVYAVVPTIARREWRGVVAVALLLGVSVAVAPDVWQRYVSEFGSISGRLVRESNGGLSAALFLRPEVFGDASPGSDLIRMIAGAGMYALIASLVLLVAIRDVPSAGWLAAPLLWPGAEYHLATMAIPVARRASIWLIAIPTIPTYLFGLIALCYEITASHSQVGSQTAALPLVRWLGPDPSERVSTSPGPA